MVGAHHVPSGADPPHRAGPRAAGRSGHASAGARGATAAGGEVLRVSRSLVIPSAEITWRATTPGGPGGQHANRTSSRVEVRFDVARSRALGPRQRARLLERLGPVVSASASDERSQARNRQLALARLAERLAAGLRVAPPRRPTAPSKAARARRLEDKRRRGARKRERRSGLDDAG